MIIIEDDLVNDVANYFFEHRRLDHRRRHRPGLYAVGVLGGVVGRRRAGVANGAPLSSSLKLAGVAVAAFGSVAICNSASARTEARSAFRSQACS